MARRPGPESTLDDVRQGLTKAATELLRERGVELGLSHITLNDTIARAGVSRSTAYRSLADDELAPQAVLHREVLTRLLARSGSTDTRSDIDGALAIVLDGSEEILASGPVSERTRVLRSLIRVGANASFHGVSSVPERTILAALYGSLQSSPGPGDWRHRALRQGEEALTKLFVDLYTGLSKVFGYQLKGRFTMGQFTVACASLVEGLAVRQGLNPEIQMTQRPTGPNGEDEEWSLFAIAFEALFVGMFEPVDPAQPFADLTLY